MKKSCREWVLRSAYACLLLFGASGCSHTVFLTNEIDHIDRSRIERVIMRDGRELEFTLDRLDRQSNTLIGRIQGSSVHIDLDSVRCFTGDHPKNVLLKVVLSYVIIGIATIALAFANWEWSAE